MDFSLTDAQVEFRDRARAVAEKLAPDYQARERAGCIHPELRREIGAAGLIAPEIPVALGGQGACCCTASAATAPSCRSSSGCATCWACRSATELLRS